MREYIYNIDRARGSSFAIGFMPIFPNVGNADLATSAAQNIVVFDHDQVIYDRVTSSVATRETILNDPFHFAGDLHKPPPQVLEWAFAQRFEVAVEYDAVSMPATIFRIGEGAQYLEEDGTVDVGGTSDDTYRYWEATDNPIDPPDYVARNSRIPQIALDRGRRIIPPLAGSQMDQFIAISAASLPERDDEDIIPASVLILVSIMRRALYFSRYNLWQLGLSCKSRATDEITTGDPNPTHGGYPLGGGRFTTVLGEMTPDEWRGSISLSVRVVSQAAP